MPFVQRHASRPQHDAHKLFVGREGKLLFFVQNILKPEEPTHNIISIYGQGGVGKSTLLTRLITEALTGDFKDYCLTAIVDERQITPTDIMGKFADQLHITGNFEKSLRKYKETLRKSQVEQETLQDIILRKVPDLTGAAAEGMPLVGPLLREGMKAAAEHLPEKYHAIQIRRDKERLENPIDDLTRDFVEELNQLTDTEVMMSSLQVKRHRRVILFFDTFEQLASVAVPWLLDYFLQATISNHVVLVTAGRDTIEHSTSDGPKPWLPYLDNHVIYSISLDSFTEDETRKYLAKQDIMDADRVNTIRQLSGGLPLYLALLTSNPHGRVDPTKDVVVNFLRWIPEQEPVKRQLALDAALLSRPFNRDDFEAFSYVSDAERTYLYQWLIELPFIRTSPLDGRHSYHDLVQALFSRHLYQRSRKEYYATREVLANSYQRQMEKTLEEEYKPVPTALNRPVFRSVDVFRSVEWLELALAAVYQLFLQTDATSHRAATEQVLQAYEQTEETEEIIRVLRKLIQEQPNNQLSSSAQQSIKLLLRYIEADPPMDYLWQELLIATNDLLKIVTRESSFSLEALATLYRKRGFAYTKFREYQQAIADYDHAIELFPNSARAYASRGSAYRDLSEYQRAIEDYNQAIELKPNFVWAYRGRGQCYNFLKEYGLAMKDLNLAIEGYPNYAIAYLVRGYIYLGLKDSVQARADFTRSWELNPKDIQARWMIERSSMSRERPESGMIQLLENIAVFDSKHYWSLVCRGVAQWLSKHFEKAHALLEQAIVLIPAESESYFWQGMTYASLAKPTAAIGAIEKALELGMPPILLRPLYWFEQEKPDFYQKYAIPLLTHYGLL
jgi:tetratricopeptide (TPR) repeat protein